jgi:hypothetical protein
MDQEKLDQMNADEIARIDSKKLDHYDVLNAMLAENCPTDKSDDGLISDFEFEGCCVSFRIKAELISTVDTIQWKIIEFEIL